MLTFEKDGKNIIKNAGMTLTDFATKMGIKKQNVNALFKTQNITTLRKVANILSVPFEMISAEVGAVTTQVVFGNICVDGKMYNINNGADFKKLNNIIK